MARTTLTSKNGSLVVNGREMRRKQRAKTMATVWRYRQLYIMFLPVLVYFVVFAYIPMTGISLAFADYRLSGFKGWAGLDNFRYIFSLKYFGQAFWNTVIIAIYEYIFSFPAPIIFALLLNEVRHSFYKKTVQTITALPNFVSWVVIAGIWMTLLSPSTGYVNAIIKALGMEPIYFLGSSTWFRPTFIFIEVWKGTGYSAIIYLAALSSIDPQLYEAAIIDGANRWQQTWHITLPGIRQTILVLFILSLNGVLTLFEPMFVLQNPMVLDVAEVLDTYTYKLGVTSTQFSVATAVGLFKSVITFALVLITNYMSKYLSDERQGAVL